MTTIKAELRNYKPLVSQPYMHIILSVPAEEATKVIEALGYPMPGESLWVEVKKYDVPPFLEDVA